MRNYRVFVVFLIRIIFVILFFVGIKFVFYRNYISSIVELFFEYLKLFWILIVFIYLLIRIGWGYRVKSKDVVFFCFLFLESLLCNREDKNL